MFNIITNSNKKKIFLVQYNTELTKEPEKALSMLKCYMDENPTDKGMRGEYGRLGIAIQNNQLEQFLSDKSNAYKNETAHSTVQAATLRTPAN